VTNCIAAGDTLWPLEALSRSMTEGSPHDTLDHLLLTTIDTYDKLDVLLWLRERGSEQDLAALVDRFESAREAVELILKELVQANLVRFGTAETRVYYCPATPKLAAAIDALAHAYAEDPLQIVKNMNRNAIKRVRSSAFNAFLSAPRSRK
jgi:hypothetical protein